MADPVRRKRPRASLPVDLSLDGAQEARLALHLVEGYRLASLDQRIGVAPREIEHVQVVEGQVAAGTGSCTRRLGCLHRLAEGASERTLSRLTGPGHDDCGHDPHHGVEGAGNGPGKVQIIHGVNDNHSYHE